MGLTRTLVVLPHPNPCSELHQEANKQPEKTGLTETWITKWCYTCTFPAQMPVPWVVEITPNGTIEQYYPKINSIIFTL